jgi:integrase
MAHTKKPETLAEALAKGSATVNANPTPTRTPAELAGWYERTHPQNHPQKVGESLSELTIESLRLASGIRAPRTLVAYDQDWKRFTAWCAVRGLDPLPASTETIAVYVTDELNRGRRITTVTRHVTSIGYAHRQARFPSPAGQPISMLINGAQRLRGEQPLQKEPVSVDQLREICRVPPSAGKHRPFVRVAIRNRAILLFGFATALRRANIAMLDFDDIDFITEGLVVNVRRGKTDQTGIGRKIGIPLGRYEETCPVRSLQQWLVIRGSSAGPLFSQLPHGQVNMRRLHPNRISIIVKRYMEQLGLNPDLYGAHSLRAGFVTAAVEAGVGEFRIAAQTGHRSLITLRKYFRSKDLFRANACAAIDF